MTSLRLVRRGPTIRIVRRDADGAAAVVRGDVAAIRIARMGAQGRPGRDAEIGTDLLTQYILARS